MNYINMNYIYTKTPHQKINSKGISSQWEGEHTIFNDDDNIINSITIKKKYGLYHADTPEYNIFKVTIPYPEKFNKITNGNQNNFLYRSIYLIWNQGYNHGIKLKNEQI